MRSSHTKASSRTHLPHHAALHRVSLDQQAAPSHQEHHPAFSAPSSTLFAVPASVPPELHVSKTASGNHSPQSGTSTPVPQLLQPYLPGRRSTPLPDSSKVQHVIG
ncbi:hypothetical protein V8E36_008680 [Tilletia maclaganii]